MNTGRVRFAVLSVCVLLSACEQQQNGWTVEGGNADSGKRLMKFYDCGSCHVIPGIRDADGVVGPPLDFWSRRGMIAGAVPNNPDNLIKWIMAPQGIEPGTAMPALGVTEAEARARGRLVHYLLGRVDLDRLGTDPARALDAFASQDHIPADLWEQLRDEPAEVGDAP